MIRRRTVLAGLGALAATGPSRLAQAAPDFSAVDAVLSRNPEELGGGCAFVLYRGTERLYSKGFGTASETGSARLPSPQPLGPWTPDTVVPIASASKWLSGGVIMALVDRGAFSLDDPVSKYLPAFGSGDKAKLKLRHCFTHTHGFPENPYHHRDTSITMEEAARRIAEVPLQFEPGTKLYYSGLGMQVAGRVAEVTVGKPWVEIFREVMGEPLAMTKTDYYAFGPTQNPNVAGSVRTSAEEYSRFALMVLNMGVYDGRRVLSEAAVRTMTSNQSGTLEVLRHPWESYSEFLKGDELRVPTAPYGIGVWLEKLDEDGTGIQMASGGAFGCQPFVYRDLNLAGCYMPYGRTMRQTSQNLAYNVASVRYFELKRVLLDLFPAA